VKIRRFVAVLILASVILSSCAPASSYRKDGITYTCIDNVEYILWMSQGITGHFKSDGSLYTCTE